MNLNLFLQWTAEKVRQQKNFILEANSAEALGMQNEMALTPQGLEDVQKIGFDVRQSLDRDHPIREYLSKYHELLRTHPSKIFDGQGNHIGNIRHVDLNGQAMAGPSEEEVQSHDHSLHHYAHMADTAIREHEQKKGRIPGLNHKTYPHYNHVDQGRRSGRGPHGPASERLSGLYPGPIT